MSGHPPSARGLRHLLPWRFALFLSLCLTSLPLMLVMRPHFALMTGFDIAVVGFMASMRSLFRHDQNRMRAQARENDANRGVILLVTGIVMLVLLLLVASELSQKKAASADTIALILVTLALAWLFSNLVYALHYAFLYYTTTGDGKDCGGLDFGEDTEPGYWDFTYFAFTLGMTFQTSDVEIHATRIRKVVILHCMAAFLFNIGLIAFTINILGQ